VLAPYASIIFLRKPSSKVVSTTNKLKKEWTPFFDDEETVKSEFYSQPIEQYLISPGKEGRVICSAGMYWKVSVIKKI